MIVGPGLSNILTEVPMGPVPFKVDLRNLASPEPGVVGTVKVVVAHDALIYFFQIYMDGDLI